MLGYSSNGGYYVNSHIVHIDELGLSSAALVALERTWKSNCGSKVGIMQCSYVSQITFGSLHTLPVNDIRQL